MIAKDCKDSFGMMLATGVVSMWLSRFWSTSA